MTQKQLMERFDVCFKGENDAKAFFAPGRVNLIGEHIDYNGGLVLPCAIQLGTYAVARPRKDRKVYLMSDNFKEMGVLDFSLDHIVYDEAMGWANYPMGVFKTFADKGFVIETGFDVFFYGDLPNGAGLSSSASIEVLTATVIEHYCSFGLSGPEIALLCQRSENNFNGVNCGIMDQFAVAMGKENHAILLDCNTLEYKHIPSALGDYRLVIVNSNKKRGLVDSAYNERRKQCEVALSILKPITGADSLCAISPSTWQSVSHYIEDAATYKRANHAIMEQYRTQKGAEALALGDLAAFGEWMYRSHDSLKYDFEVSCHELDVIVEASKAVRGVLGARMTGAGFGGCVVALVHKDYVSTYEAVVKAAALKQSSLEPHFYVATISGGSGALND